MPITSNRKDLFRSPTTEDKLTLFQSLLEGDELTVSLTLAMLKVIHGELRTNQNDNRSVYRRYAGTIESLRYHMLDTLQLTVAAWKNYQAATSTPAEWFPENTNPQEKGTENI
jgi:hypothetical protein